MSNKLVEQSKSFQDYVTCTHEISKLGLSSEDNKLLVESLTVRNTAIDYPVVLELLREKVPAKHLKACFTFMLARGNRPNDHRVITTLLKAGVKVDHLEYCSAYLIARGNAPADVPRLEEFAKTCQD